VLHLLPLIFRNVLRNRRRSLLTLLSVAVSLCILALMVALYQGFFLPETTSPAQTRRIVVRHKVSLTQSLPVSYEQKIKSVEGVMAVTQYQWFGGVYKDSRDPKNFFANFGVEPETTFEVFQDFKTTPQSLERFKRERTACLVTPRLAEQFNWKIGDRITITSEIFNRSLELTLVGTVTGPTADRDKVMWFSRQYLREVLAGNAASQDYVGTFFCILRSPDDVPRVTRTIEAMFANAPEPVRSETEQQFGVSFISFLGNVKLYIGVICAAVTFTILLVTANTVAMAVRERTREFAILRTLGYSPGEVLVMVITESALLAIIGGFVGTGLAALLIQAMSGTGFLDAVNIRPSTLTLTLSVAAFVGLTSAIAPAIIASRKNIVESLRFVG
jgi:putative ABC transport system permease protein